MDSVNRMATQIILDYFRTNLMCQQYLAGDIGIIFAIIISGHFGIFISNISNSISNIHLGLNMNYRELAYSQFKKIEIEEIWSCRNLKLKKFKLKKFEVEEIWSWKIIEVGEIWSWRNLKLKKFEVDEIQSWRNLNLNKFEFE